MIAQIIYCLFIGFAAVGLMSYTHHAWTAIVFAIVAGIVYPVLKDHQEAR